MYFKTTFLIPFLIPFLLRHLPQFSLLIHQIQALWELFQNHIRLSLPPPSFTKYRWEVLENHLRLPLVHSLNTDSVGSTPESPSSFPFLLPPPFPIFIHKIQICRKVLQDHRSPTSPVRLLICPLHFVPSRSLLVGNRKHTFCRLSSVGGFCRMIPLSMFFSLLLAGVN